MERRSMLALTGTTLAAALAGCAALGDSADPTETDGPTDTDGPADAPTDTPTNGSPTETATDDPTDTATDTPTDAPTDTPTDDPTDTPTDEPTQTPGPSAELVNGSFEDDWAGWTVGRHLPDDPNRDDYEKVATEAGVTTRDSTDGSTGCRLFIDGSQDDGTVWVQQPVDLSGYDYLAVDYLVSDSFNQIRNAAVYAGPEPDAPLTERDFDTSQSLEGHETPGWKTLTYEVDHDGPGLVAVGFSVVWETGIDALLDDVRLTEDPPAKITPTQQPTEVGGDGDESDEGGSI